jgi:hypothetical protein
MAPSQMDVLDKLRDSLEELRSHDLMVRMRLLNPEGARRKDPAEGPDCHPRFEFVTGRDVGNEHCAWSGVGLVSNLPAF